LITEWYAFRAARTVKIAFLPLEFMTVRESQPNYSHRETPVSFSGEHSGKIILQECWQPVGTSNHLSHEQEQK
jgi:hypothetical protein